MPIILENAKATGQAEPYIVFMLANNISRSKSFEILNTRVAPPTYKLGNTRFIDVGLGRAWFAALAEGKFTITAKDLWETRKRKVAS